MATPVVIANVFCTDSEATGARAESPAGKRPPKTKINSIAKLFTVLLSLGCSTYYWTK